MGPRPGPRPYRMTGKVVKCPTCGKEKYKRRSEILRNRRYCSRECASSFMRGINHPRYNPNAQARRVDGKKTRIYRILIEQILGRKLKRTEVIHHWDKDTQNNTPSNLLICNQSYHAYLHGKERWRNGELCFNKN